MDGSEESAVVLLMWVIMYDTHHTDKGASGGFQVLCEPHVLRPLFIGIFLASLQVITWEGKGKKNAAVKSSFICRCTLVDEWPFFFYVPLVMLAMERHKRVCFQHEKSVSGR